MVAVTLPLLVLTGCASMNVSSHVERSIDFGQYRTYDWGPADALPTGDPRLDQNPGYCDDGCDPRVTEYEAGTLVLDIVDTRTNRVIWRGWAQDSVEDALDNPDEMERQINDGVTRMLDRLPQPF
jgi:hypothetical protein